MKTDRLPQHTERDVVPEAGQARGDQQLAQHGGWPLGVPLPLLMTAAQLRQVFQIGESRYFELKALGRYQRFEAPSIGGPIRYSGEKVRAFLLNEQPTRTRTFGAKRGPRTVKQVPVFHDAGRMAR